MSIPKVLFLGTVSLFAVIGGVALIRKKPEGKKPVVSAADKVQPPAQIPAAPAVKGDVGDDFPNIDRIFQLFTTGQTRLPIVETVTYASSVPWLKGRPAWIADYASHYGTSRHFIARGLNGRPDYFTQKVAAGKQFNVFRKDKRLQFHLLVDLTRCKMGFYYLDLDTKERVLLKTYSVGVAPHTPLGTYSLGSKIAVYKPGSIGLYREQKVEMISVFGTRWIPFHETVEGAPIANKGYGLHGAPWTLDSQTGQFVERTDFIGRGDSSDGSITLKAVDLEELFAIIITKPSFVTIVKDFHVARLPGIEVATPAH